MHGRYEDITKVDFTLIEPSQMIGGRGGGELWLAHLRKPRRGQGSFDLSCVLIASAHVSAKGKGKQMYPIYMLTRMRSFLKKREIYA